jgi:hypothetical protein
LFPFLLAKTIFLKTVKIFRAVGENAQEPIPYLSCGLFYGAVSS